MFPADARAQATPAYAGFYGSAALLFGSGTLLGFAADDVQQELQARPHTAARVTELQDEGEAKQTYANIAFGVGAAALASGVIFHVLDSEDGKRSRLELRTDLRSVSLDWRF
jgi:catechol 2,3-dioxygenase-like lactoylglutathione lyase family enzyme